MHQPPAGGAVPAQRVERALGPRQLHHHADRVGEAHGAVRHVRRVQVEGALVDGHVADLRGPVGDGRGGLGGGAQQHAAAVLVEELRRRVDVEVAAGVGAADDLRRRGVRMGGGTGSRRKGEGGKRAMTVMPSL